MRVFELVLLLMLLAVAGLGVHLRMQAQAHAEANARAEALLPQMAAMGGVLATAPRGGQVDPVDVRAGLLFDHGARPDEVTPSTQRIEEGLLERRFTVVFRRGMRADVVAYCTQVQARWPQLALVALEQRRPDARPGQKTEGWRWRLVYSLYQREQP